MKNLVIVLIGLTPEFARLPGFMVGMIVGNNNGLFPAFKIMHVSFLISNIKKKIVMIYTQKHIQIESSKRVKRAILQGFV